MSQRYLSIDGNEACARVAYRASEVISIYPITPASPMGEHADAWAARGLPNVWGTVPEVVEMQSEGGAAGAVHGSLSVGALTTTFTASQGLLLMLPNLFKVAGELTPAVVHVAARSIATHALSIFCDHGDVMSARGTGLAMLCASSVQEAQDLALVAHAATLETRVPFLHFFDGFRTSHEVNKIAALSDDDIRALLSLGRVFEHRGRGLSPDHPVLRGSAQNPDVFFQSREAQNPFYDRIPTEVQQAMDRLAERTGRSYHLFDYHGHPEADRVIVIMGSGAGAAREAVDALQARGEKVGVLKVRLFRPFAADAFLQALPGSARRVAVLDRTKEPGAPAEPLHLDVQVALSESDRSPAPRVTGGRYGLGSKEFTPQMAMAVFQDLEADAPRRRFTVGIRDDVTHLSLAHDDDAFTEGDDVVRAVFFGLGSDGTVSANKSSVKIIGSETELFAQGYFVYDSKKAGSTTCSHLRFGPRPIESTYLIRQASFVACHQFGLLERVDVLGLAQDGATFLLNSPFAPDEVWAHLPRGVQEAVIGKHLRFFVVDANRIAEAVGLGRRVNTVLQTCFFGLAGILPRPEAAAAIKRAIKKTYGRRGPSVLERNNRAVDAALGGLHEVTVPGSVTSSREPPPFVSADAPEFVQRVTALLLAGKGDLLPVSAFPVDGTYPTGTARFEKRGIAREVPIWKPEICIECAKCAIVCPHAAIRLKVYDEAAIEGAPEGFKTRRWSERGRHGAQMTIQVAPDDCTGCGVCVDVCPAKSKEEARVKAINMEPKERHLEVERASFDFFLNLPEPGRETLSLATVKGSQQLEPLFEFSGACLGCGETPYLKLLTQLFGDRIVVANATGCSSIYGGNLPTTPWGTNREGRGPAWSNSLFEDNAEFGLGIRLGLDRRRARAEELVRRLASRVGGDLAGDLLDADQTGEAGIRTQRGRVARLKERLQTLEGNQEAQDLRSLADDLVERSVWIVGGDGWAYDIGFGGLDHVLASGRDVNVLVLDTEVYSNTGGQASKATPRAAVAKFASSGKSTGKKDLGMIAMAYGNVYVAHVAMGGSDTQTVRALLEAASWPGPSLVIAYSPCIAHGIDMRQQMRHQKEAVQSGYWPLYRYDPRHAHLGEHPFRLDSRKPRIPLRQFAESEARFAILQRADPKRARELLDLAQQDVDERYRLYEQTAGLTRVLAEAHEDEDADGRADD